MSRFSYVIIILLLMFLSACGAGQRSIATSASQCTTNADCAAGNTCSGNICVPIPGYCTLPTDCPSGYTCTGNTCVISPTTPSNPTVSTSCEYYGYSSTSDSTICDNGISSVSFSSIRGDTTMNGSSTDWRSGLGYMRVAEAQALLANKQALNIHGFGMKVSVIGSGVNNVILTPGGSSEIGVSSLSADYGFAHNNTDSGGIFNEVTRTYAGYARPDWRLYNPGGDMNISYNDYDNVVTGNTCSSNDLENSACSKKIYTYQDYHISNGNGELTFRDRDWFTYGTGDVAQGTQLASIISKDDTDNMVGVAKDAEVVSVKTQFLYQKTNYLSGTDSGTTYNINNTYSYTLQDNTGIILNNALTYARANSDVVLFNNHLRYTTNNHKHYFLINYPTTISISCDYDGDRTECGSDTGDERSFAELINQSTNTHFTSFKNQLNDVSDIYVTPIANSLISNLISNSNGADSRSYPTLLGVADVNVSSITYCANNTDSGCTAQTNADGTDQYGIAGVREMALNTSVTGGFKNGYDCSSIVDRHCVIAPANVRSLSNSGTYIAMDSQEYSGSAYVAGIITAIRGAYSTSVLSNEDIIAKIIASATDPSKITGCNTVTKNCGAGMINFYAVVKAIVSSPITVSTSSSASFALSDTHLRLSSAFGDSIANNGKAILESAVFFDDYNFAYNAGLSQRVSSIPTNKIMLSNLLDGNQIHNSTNYNIGNNASFNLSTNQDNSSLSKRFTTDYAEDEVVASISNIKLTESIGKIDLNIGFNGSNIGNNLYSNPVIKSSENYLTLTQGDNNNSIGISKKLYKNFSLNSGWLHTSDNSLYVTGIDYTSDQDSKVSLSLGLLHENNKILGAETSGGFGIVNSSDTHYLNLAFIHNVNDYELFGNIATGITKVDMDNNSLVTDISDITTQELQLGINKNLQNNSLLGFSYTEPLRVTSGSMELTVPTHRNLSGIAFNSQKISVKPYGKERNYEIYFNKELNNRTTLSMNLLKITEEGNIQNTKNNNMVLFKIKKIF